MKANFTRNNDTLIISLEGKLHADEVKDLDEKLKSVAGFSNLIIDLAKLKSISSSGIRLLLACHHTMVASNGSIRIINANDEIRGLFEMTGFSNLLEEENVNKR